MTESRTIGSGAMDNPSRSRSTTRAKSSRRSLDPFCMLLDCPQRDHTGPGVFPELDGDPGKIDQVRRPDRGQILEAIPQTMGGSHRIDG